MSEPTRGAHSIVTGGGGNSDIPRRDELAWRRRGVPLSIYLPRHPHALAHGSITSTPVSEKSRTFRVATAMPRERAMAAI